MISLPLVAIFLVAKCLTTVTAGGSDGFSVTDIAVTVTPVNWTHLSFDYQESVKIEDYNKVQYASIKFNVSIIIQIISP